MQGNRSRRVTNTVTISSYIIIIVTKNRVKIMILLHAFKESLKLPNKQALFKLNRLGMDIVVIYMFILIFVISLPSLIEQLISPGSLGSYLNMFFLIIYFFFFYYLPMTLFIFILISAIAYIGKGLAMVMKRKLHYSILWKMCAFSTTTPLLLFTVTSIFFPLNNLVLGIILLYIMLLLIRMIAIYPKRKIRTS